MHSKICPAISLFLLLTITGVAGVHADDIHDSKVIDRYSYNLGGLNVWLEVIAIGIKKMALSSAVSPQEMDGLEAKARSMAEEADVKLYREADFIVTDLFPRSATQGKHVLIVYRGSTLDEYMALKARKTALVEAGEYAGKARLEIAWDLGKLLSYPDARIRELLGSNAAGD